MAVSNHVLFYIDSETYAVDVADAGSIEKNTTYNELPGMPSYMKGVFELRNELIPVISVRELFHRKEETKEEHELILSTISGFTVAYLVDRVDSIVPMEIIDKSTLPLLQRIDQEYIRHIGSYEEKIIVVLDLKKMMNEEQLDIVSKLVNDKKKRDEEALLAAQLAEQKRKEEEKKKEEAGA